MNRKDVFKAKLTGEPVNLITTELDVSTIQMLIDCRVLEQFAAMPRSIDSLRLIFVKYHVIVSYGDDFRVTHLYPDDVLEIKKHKPLREDSRGYY